MIHVMQITKIWQLNDSADENDTGDFIDNDDDDDDDRDVYTDKDGDSFNLSDAALNNGDSDEYAD